MLGSDCGIGTTVNTIGPVCTGVRTGAGATPPGAVAVSAGAGLTAGAGVAAAPGESAVALGGGGAEAGGLQLVLRMMAALTRIRICVCLLVINRLTFCTPV